MFCLNKVVNEAWLFLFPVCFHLLKKRKEQEESTSDILFSVLVFYHCWIEESCLSAAC